MLDRKYISQNFEQVVSRLATRGPGLDLPSMRPAGVRAMSATAPIGMWPVVRI